MRTYTIKKIQGAPDWETVPVMPIDNVCWNKSADISAQAQICWDENNLYLKLQAREAEIRMEEKGKTAEPCLDSCLEFFFRPTDAMDYFNVEFNPNAALWLGYGSEEIYLIRLLPPHLDKDFKPQVTFTAPSCSFRIFCTKSSGDRCRTVAKSTSNSSSTPIWVSNCCCSSGAHRRPMICLVTTVAGSKV